MNLQEDKPVIQCVCLNPVLQRTLTIEDFALNAVNRVKGKVVESSAGKGINTARALHILGRHPVITGFCGGETGELVTRALERDNFSYEFVQTANKTRICTTILDPVQKTQTEIVEEGLPITSSEVARMTALFRKHLSRCQLVTISGTAPQQVPDTIYYDFVIAAADQHIPTLIDTQQALLRECLKAKPFLLKVNREELATAFQTSLDSPKTLLTIIQQVVQTGVKWVVITDGQQPTLVAHQSHLWEIIPPAIQPVNPIGAGDVMLGGIASALIEGQDVLQAVQFGTACGTASTFTKTPGMIHTADVERLAAEVRVIQST